MANFNVVGFDDVEKQFLHQAENATKAVPLMLRAGADVLVEAQQAEAQTMGIRRTGDFIGSIGIYKEEIKGTSSTVIIMAKGKDSKGVRNVEKGFIVHYGLKKGSLGKNRKKTRKDGSSNINNRNQTARPWMDKANEKSDEKVHQAMMKIWEDINNGT